MATIPTGGGITHSMATCNLCQWREEDPKKTTRAARKHTDKTGHETTVETAYFRKYIKG